MKFPSGIEIKNLGSEARCMECHQGRESTVSVTNAISNTFKLKDADEDTVVKPLVTTDASGKTVTTTFGFRNVHYYRGRGHAVWHPGQGRLRIQGPVV